MTAPFRRKTNNRNVRKILIVCEGEKTEPNYFEKFPINKELIDIKIEGNGRNTDSLVERAIELKEAAERNNSPFIQVWCVFDKDANSVQNFNRAVDLAKNNKIKIAYSNEAFELWYILHFEFLTAGIKRDKYIKKLDKHLKHKYQKNSESMYKELKGKQQTAIENAKKLLKTYPISNPANDNPSTTVHKLVEELNKFCS